MTMEEAGQALCPLLASRHSWAVSMALKGPCLGFGRTKGLERKRKEKDELLFPSSLDANISLGADGIGK